MVTGKIYRLKQHFLPPATVWRFTKIKEVLLKNTQVVIQSDSHMPQENECRKVLNNFEWWGEGSSADHFFLQSYPHLRPRSQQFCR